jgi:hypothetical protein
VVVSYSTGLEAEDLADSMAEAPSNTEGEAEDLAAAAERAVAATLSSTTQVETEDVVSATPTSTLEAGFDSPYIFDIFEFDRNTIWKSRLERSTCIQASISP